MPNDCISQGIVAPAIAQNVAGVPILARMRAVEVSMGQAAEVQWTMVTPQGEPVDLTDCIPPSGPSGPSGVVTLVVAIREVLSFNQQSQGITLAVNVIDATNGLVSATLAPAVVECPGISFMEWAVLSPTGGLIFSNVSYLIVNRGQFGQNGVSQLGPPTIPEIRLHLRDSAPADNLWLGIQEFDMAEIAACIQRPLDYFNDSQPPLRVLYRTSTFPWRYYWLQGIIGCLYQMASIHYTRVHLPYQQQGGLMVDDKNKASEYAAIGDKVWNEYKDWVLRKKVQINAQGCIQMVASPYSGYFWGRGGL